jgi:hypothetical protein
MELIDGQRADSNRELNQHDAGRLQRIAAIAANWFKL